MMVFAHRGVSALFPENSQTAISAFDSDTMHGIEIDIIQIKDNFIVYHDRWLTRILGIHQRTCELDSEQLAQLVLKDGNPIPDLSWLIAYCATNPAIQLNIELKQVQDISLFLTQLENACQQHQFPLQQIIISSFNHNYLKQIEQSNSNVKLGLLLANYPLEIKHFQDSLSFYSVHLDFEIVDENLVTQFKSLGYLVFVYTVDNEVEIKWLQSIGVDGIFANDPSQAFKIANNLT